MKLSQIISCICVCVLLMSNVAFSADYTELKEHTNRISVLLSSSASDVKQLIGQMAILIAEYDVLTSLEEKGASSQARALKAACDDAFRSVSSLDAGRPFEAASELCSQLTSCAAILNGDAPAVSFVDVEGGSWYYDAVNYAVSQGIFKGMSETQFAPDMAITRGMFLTLMGRMYMDEGTSYPQGYSDVADGEYYADAVNWAKENGILSFIYEENFYPDRPITREELVTVLRGSMAFGGRDASVENQSAFTDSADVSEWARDSVSWAAENKIVSGFEDGSFRPQATATRAQVAQIFYNMG